jgi:excisionase family DNA binding protein
MLVLAGVHDVYDMAQDIYTIRAMAPRAPITVKQAAAILDCSKGHVQLLIRRGRIEAVPFGKVYLVNAASVAHYLKHERQPGRGRPRKAKNRRKYR